MMGRDDERGEYLWASRRASFQGLALPVRHTIDRDRIG